MLNRKMLRDLKNQFGQFLAVFLLCALALASFTCFRSTDNGAYEALDDFNESCKTASAWIYGESFSEDNAGRVAGLDEITETQLRTRLSAESTDQKQAQVDLYLENDNRLSRPKVVEGEEIDFHDTDSLWINRQFADAWDLKPGDAFSFSCAGQTVTKTIAGLILSPEYIYMKADDDLDTDFRNIAYVYMAKEAFPFNEMIPFNQLLVRTGQEDVMALEEKAASALDDHYAVFIDKNSLPGIRVFDDEIHQHEQFSYLFAVIFVLVSLLIIMTAMRRMIDSQRTQIGTMNALGLKRSTITLHYMSYSFFVSVLGSILGILIGPATIGQYMIDIFGEFYSLPDWGMKSDPGYFLCAAAVIGCCTFAAWFSCRRLLKVEPAEALRPAPPKSGKRTLFEKLPVWDHLGFTLQYDLRDAARSKLRILMSIVGTMCGMMLMVCAFACSTTIDETYSWNFDRLTNYNTQVTFESGTDLATEESLRDQYEGELIMTAGIELSPEKKAVSEKKETATLTITEGKNLYGLTGMDLESEKLSEGEVALTYKLAKKLGIKEGDDIWWHVYDHNEWYWSKVGLINRNPMTTGITMLRGDLEADTSVAFEPSALLTSEQVKKTDNGSISSVSTKSEMIKAFDSMVELISVLYVFFIVLSLLFVLLVLYNSGSLTFNERQREFGTLKVMGFQTGQIRKLFTVQNIGVTVIGMILGAPLGKVMLQYMFDSNGDAFDYQIVTKPSDYLIAGACVLLTAILVSFLFSRRIRRLDMTEALKDME
ncbi:MAG: FtsX-like permease family protein [Firmicutes bacterium]|nr:FtsX-like permease family protein [Bacillota bacterium]